MGISKNWSPKTILSHTPEKENLMKYPKNARKFLCVVLAVLLLLSMMPVSAEAKSSSEIREQIKEMKAEFGIR